MTQKPGKLMAGVGATVAGLAVFLARQLDLFADDAARVIPPPPVVSGAGDVLQDPGVQSSLKTAVSSYRALRQGTPEETVVANVGCQIMNTDLANSLTQDGYEQQIRRELPLEYQSGPESLIVD